MTTHNTKNFKISVNPDVDFSHVSPEGASDKFKNTILELGAEYILLDFYADWCNPCIAMSKHLESTKKDLINKGLDFEFKKINIESDYDAIDSIISIQSIPHCILVKKNKDGVIFLNHFTGSKNSDDILNFVLNNK